MRVFITGGAGFIGSRLVAALAERGAECQVFDNLHPQVHGPTATPPALPAGTTFVRGDVGDRAALLETVHGFAPDVVYHLASETGTGQSLDEVTRYCQANVMGTAHLLEAMRSAPRPVQRAVLASSRAVYGEGPYRGADGEIITPPPRSLDAMQQGRFEPGMERGLTLTPLAATESAAIAPSSIYASTKLMQEHLFQQVAQASPWSVAILRLQNVYGAGQSLNNPYTGVLSIFTDILLKGGDLEIFEDGQIVRDFIHVSDVVDALVLAGEFGRPATLLNIGSGERISIIAAARALTTAAGRSGEPFRISGRFRPGDIRHALADISAARDTLGWRPRTSFEAGVSDLVAWARSFDL